MKNPIKGLKNDFRNFVNKGSVIDLAVAVVIGTSFNAVVNTLANKIISPAISFFVADLSFDNLKTVLKPEVRNEAGEVISAEIALEWGVFFRAAISFLITAIFTFLTLKFIIFLKDRIKKVESVTKEEAKRALQYLDGDPATPPPRLSRKERKKRLKEEQERLAEEKRKKEEEEKEKQKSEEQKQRELLEAILENLQSINKNTAKEDPGALGGGALGDGAPGEGEAGADEKGKAAPEAPEAPDNARGD